jgi:diguanylate cyclase (GGDEF)-like protein
MGPVSASVVDAAVPSAASADSVSKTTATASQATAERRQGAIFAIAALATSGRELDSMLAEVHRLVLGLLPCDLFLVSLREPQSDAVRVVVSTPTPTSDPDRIGPDENDVATTLARLLSRQAGSVRGDGLELGRRFPGLVPLGMEDGHWLAASIPGEEAPHGALVLHSPPGSAPFASLDQGLLEFVAGQIEVALHLRAEDEPVVSERADELMQELIDHQRSEKLQAALFSIGELANGTATGERFYAAVHDIIGDVLECRNICVAQLTPNGDWLDFPYYVNDREPIPAAHPPARGLHEWVIRHRAPLNVDLGSADSRAHLAQLVATGELVEIRTQPGAWLGVPLVRGNEVIGVISVQSYAPDPPYDDRDQEFLAFLAYQVGNALERQQAAASLRQANATLEQRVADRTRQLQNQMEAREQIEQQLKHETRHDFLTGLPNRAFLCDRLMRSLALQSRDSNKAFAVLFMDLDRFKVINDSAGHIVGDGLLKEVGKRLQGCVRAPDMVARLGGDEFAILIEEAGEILDTAIKVAQRIIEDLQEPILVEGRELFTSVSIGIAISAPEYRMAEEMLRDADIAMYRAKASETQRFEIFNEGLHLEAIRALETEGDLHRAVARQEFEPYFQQIVRLDTGAVSGYESLLRWNHPERGVLAPDAFLSIAEASGSLETIDWQMFDLTCAAVSRLVRPGQYVNLNFSPRHFRDKQMDQRLLALLREHGVSPSQVRIEVTEGTLIENSDQVAEIIDRLHQAGVLTSLDDFGTGYSSLSYLHRFRLHAVKIDRSFVTPLKPGGGGASEAVVKAILALAKSQGLDVIAEGVETVTQRDALLALGCQSGQGWLYSRPQPLNELQSVW